MDPHPLIGQLDAHAELPDLPELDALLEAARQRRTYFAALVAVAQTEVDQAERFIAQLTGRVERPSRARREPRVSPGIYRAILGKLAEHRYAGLGTLESSGVASSTASRAMRQAVAAGHAEREVRGRKHRYSITEAGLEYLTEPGAA